MEASFWQEKWEKNELGFHRSEANPLLVNHFQALALAQDSRVFLPLCGKTLDIAWLLSQGYRVAGAELIATAIEQLFAELGVDPEVASLGEVTHYSANNIDIYVGDIFNLSDTAMGPVDAVYDRAALVALPADMRTRYTAHIREITDSAPQLLINYEYDQSLMAGPPFSVSNEEVLQHYRKSYDLTLLASTEVEGGLKGICPAQENVWLLQNGPRQRST
jgi:thiopurine S-methyltransferase